MGNVVPFSAPSKLRKWNYHAVKLDGVAVTGNVEASNVYAAAATIYEVVYGSRCPRIDAGSWTSLTITQVGYNIPAITWGKAFTSKHLDTGNSPAATHTTHRQMPPEAPATVRKERGVVVPRFFTVKRA